MTVNTASPKTVLSPLKSKFSELSIRAKLAAVIALGFVATFAVCLSLMASNIRTIGFEQQIKNATLEADLLTGQMQAPIRFKDGDRLSEIFRPAVENDPGLMRIDIRHLSGDSLAQFERAPIELEGLETAIAATRETLNISTLQYADFFATVRPVLSKDGSALMGVAAYVWDTGTYLDSLVNQVLQVAGIGALVACVGFAGIFAVISRLVTRPVSKLSVAMEAVSDRQFDTAIPCTERNDEIGVMASTLETFRDRLAEEDRQNQKRHAEAALRQKLFHKLGDHMSQLAAGRTDCELSTDEFDGLDRDHVAICDSFNDVLSNLRMMLSTVFSTADSVRTSAQEISEVAEDQSRRSEAQAATLEESAAAIEDLNASVQTTAQLAADANERIAHNKRLAAAGGEVVDKTVKAMRDIEHSSQQITAITGVIDDIAFQTNLLALNAGVEAARAGETGRGFAVVASEVRALAQRASDSANEIKDLIKSSGAHVSEGSELANKAGAALSDIIDGVNHVSDLVSNIATGSREQATNLAEIKEGVTELDKVTQQNAAVIEESSAASRSLSNEAHRLTEALRQFEIDTVDLAVAEPGPAPYEDRDSGWGTGGGVETADIESQPKVVFSSRASNSQLAVAEDEGWDEF